MDNANITKPQPIRFSSSGRELAGHLYMPFGPGPWPAVVVTGGGTCVKEQMPAIYARALVERGYAALCFDFRGWGQSPGAPPYLEDPLSKMADIAAAFSYLAVHEEIDEDRIAGLAICESAGYMCYAAINTPIPCAICLVAPWLHDKEIMTEAYGGQEKVADLMAVGRAAAEAGEPRIVQAASASNPDAVMYQDPYYTEPNRGLIPEYDNKFNLASWERWLSFDAISAAAELRLPTRLIHSRSAAIPRGAERFAARMGKRAELVWLDGATQYDFYDHPEVVAAATRHVLDHLHAHV